MLAFIAGLHKLQWRIRKYQQALRYSRKLRQFCCETLKYSTLCRENVTKKIKKMHCQPTSQFIPLWQILKCLVKLGKYFDDFVGGADGVEKWV